MLKDLKHTIKTIKWCDRKTLCNLSIKVLILIIVYGLLIKLFDFSSTEIINLILNI